MWLFGLENQLRWESEVVGERSWREGGSNSVRSGVREQGGGGESVGVIVGGAVQIGSPTAFQGGAGKGRQWVRELLGG